ncbi:hypothetical protein ACFLSU_01650 [Bacteroidota bacterium]
MNTTEIDLEELFLTRRTKQSLLDFATSTPNSFKQILLYGLESEAINSWRAAWLICHLMKKNDVRIQPYLALIIKNLPIKSDGHQRQLLIILMNMELSEDLEGIVFNLALNIWEDVHKIPSTRITAFKLIHKTVKKHPELTNEIDLWTADYYTKTLSPGIKKSLIRIKTSLL